MEVHLSPDQADFILERVRNGRFEGADAAVCEAVSLLEQVEENKKSERPAGRKSLAQLFAESPFRGLDIEFPRDKTPLRSVDLWTAHTWNSEEAVHDHHA